MNIDIVSHLGAVTRDLVSREHEGRPAQVLTASRDYPTDPDDLWDAITNPQRIPRWFFPISGDLRLGGNYQLEGHASGTITNCDKPNKLTFTWEFNGEVSWVELNLHATETGTHLSLEHIAHVPQEMWDQFGPGAVGVGWDMTLFGLAQHIETQSSISAAEAMAWLLTEDGKNFVGRSSDDWRRVSVDLGTDPQVAADAADRTTAFYTGG